MKENENYQTSWIIKINDNEDNITEYKVLMSFRISNFEKQYIVYEPLQKKEFEKKTLIVASVEWTQNGLILMDIDSEDEKEIVKKIIENEKL